MLTMKTRLHTMQVTDPHQRCVSTTLSAFLSLPAIHDDHSTTGSLFLCLFLAAVSAITFSAASGILLASICGRLGIGEYPVLHLSTFALIVAANSLWKCGGTP